MQIHWQVAQATSLQNIQFNMVVGGGTANKQQGIFMDNGSGKYLTFPHTVQHADIS
jgi:glucan 1,3-beta-glucosidase